MSILMIYKQDRPERPEKFPFIEIINWIVCEGVRLFAFTVKGSPDWTEQ